MTSYHDEFPSQFLKAADIRAVRTVSMLSKKTSAPATNPKTNSLAHFKEDGQACRAQQDAV